MGSIRRLRGFIASCGSVSLRVVCRNRDQNRDSELLTVTETGTDYWVNRLTRMIELCEEWGV